MLLMDIDGLSTINLTHGRAYGDQLLKDIADLCNELEGVDTAYHVDHNYFALTLCVHTEEEVRQVYRRIADAMLERCTFTASAVPVDKTIFYHETQLLDAVNMTLKKAKDISNNRLEFFSSEDLTAKISSLELLEELKQSVENGFQGFELYYQPQIQAGTYEIYGVEALLRYNSAVRGRVFPDEFIPVLEQSRLIKDVGLWVLQQALMQCKAWREQLPDLHVSVNFSALQFEDPQLAEKVIAKVNEAGLTGDALTVEITESVELHNSPQLLNTMKELKQYHINFAIDDFGTGYANLGYLKKMSVDEIKIDRVFVSGVEKETYNHKLIRNVIEFAKGNDIRTCCEGVENARELVTLERLLPDIIQGYLFDKPCTSEQIEKTYIDASAKAYKERTKFIKKIHELREKMGVVHFDPQDILRENEVGLWMMRVSDDWEHGELHMDETMERLLAVDAKYTPKDCYEYWRTNIHPDHCDAVGRCLDEMKLGKNAVQAEFVWRHPDGDVHVRFSGKRVSDSNGLIVLEGYYRNIPPVTGA